MHVDKFGQQVLSEQDLCDLYMSDPSRIIKNALVRTNIDVSVDLGIENSPKLKIYSEPTLTVNQFDYVNQQQWLMPKEYQELDIAQFVLDQCKTEPELQRAGEELIKFQERDMFMLLRYLKYLVDTMRTHNIVWGVGRGSSVSSYVLYLIGIHRINSLFYDLSIDEFLK